MLVAPRKHPLAKAGAIALGDLEQEPFLLIDAGARTGAILRQYFREKGFAPEIMLDSGSFEVIKRFVAAEVGVSFLPDISVSPEDELLAIIPMPDLPTVVLGAVWRTGAYVSKAQETFLALLRQGGAGLTRIFWREADPPESPRHGQEGIRSAALRGRRYNFSRVPNRRNPSFHRRRISKKRAVNPYRTNRAFLNSLILSRAIPIRYGIAC